jgi:hypothetical protein
MKMKIMTAKCQRKAKENENQHHQWRRNGIIGSIEMAK